VNKMMHSWVFWTGVGIVTFAYFTAKGSSDQTGEGIDNALTIIGLGAGAALIIYAVNSKPATI